jgi:SAM-dependent methyltransferase
MEHLLDKTFQAERDHFWFKGFRQFIAPLVGQSVAGFAAPRVLDCGCGTGTNLATLALKGNAFGFDLTMRGLRYARQNGRQRVAHASITHIPFAPDAFDLVTSFDVLQCLDEEQEALAIGGMARVMKPGGRLILNVAALELLRGSHAVLAEEKRRYTRPMLRRPLERAGLVVERMTYTNFSLFPLMLMTRTWQRLKGETSQSALESDLTVPSAPTNTLLTAALSAEARALRLMDMPIGSSILCMARKPAGDRRGLRAN